MVADPSAGAISVTLSPAMTTAAMRWRRAARLADDLAGMQSSSRAY